MGIEKQYKIPFVIGTSFNVAPLDVLEKLAITKDELASVLKEISSWAHMEDLVVLSTCNRTELLGTSTDVDATLKKITTYLNTFGENTHLLPKYLFCYRNQQAISHLFEVICGIDSMILGETEIVGQMQQAYNVSLNEGFVSTYFKQVFDAINRTNRRVRNETCIDKGTTSVAKAGVHMAKRIVGDLSKRAVLMVGAGETGSLVCSYLKEENAEIHVSNRTVEKAAQLAKQIDGHVVPFDEIETTLAKVDVIILATNAKTPLITYDMVARAQKKRKGELLLIVDISVPHNADVSVTNLGNVFLIDMNDLKEVVAQSISNRIGEKKKGLAIIEQEVELFYERQQTLEMGPLISQLRCSFESIRRQEITKYAHRFSDTDQEALEQFATSMVNKLLHWPTVGARELANDTNASFDKAKWFEELFGLNKTAAQRKKKK